MQHGAKDAIVAKLGIGEHGGHREATRAHLPQQRQRLAPFCLEADARRDARLLAGRVGDPFFGQIERSAEQVCPNPGPERRRDGDLTIGDLPQRATVLARDTDRLPPLFRETGAVEDQHSLVFGNQRAQLAPDAFGIPGPIGNEVLEGLIRAGIGDARQHRFHRLARAVAEESLHVPSQREYLRAMAEACLERFEPRHQSSQLVHRAAVGHRDGAYRIRAKSTMSSNQITRESVRKSNDLTK